MSKKPKMIDPPHLSLLDALTGELPPDFQRYEQESRERMLELIEDLKPESWFDLAFKLMRKYDPAFKSIAKRGRPKKWTHFRLLVLAGEFYRLREHEGCASDEEAFGRLAIMEPWRRLIDRKNEMDTLEATPADALRVALNGAGDAVNRAGRDAYLYHFNSGTVDSWKNYLKLIHD